MNKIKLSEEGRAHIPVNMKLYNDSLLEKVIFKLDTGADLTTINKKDLVILGYSKEWIKENAVKSLTCTISGAGGKIESAYYVVVPISNILGRDLHNWTFYIRMDDDKDFPNLLGIDILLNFNFTFNYDIGFLSIEPACNPIIKKQMIKNQRIEDINKSEKII